MKKCHRNIQITELISIAAIVKENPKQNFILSITRWICQVNFRTRYRTNLYFSSVSMRTASPITPKYYATSSNYLQATFNLNLNHFYHRHPLLPWSSKKRLIIIHCKLLHITMVKDQEDILPKGRKWHETYRKAHIYLPCQGKLFSPRTNFILPHKKIYEHTSSHAYTYTYKKKRRVFYVKLDSWRENGGWALTLLHTQVRFV